MCRPAFSFLAVAGMSAVSIRWCQPLDEFQVGGFEAGFELLGVFAGERDDLAVVFGCLGMVASSLARQQCLYFFAGRDQTSIAAILATRPFTEVKEQVEL
jgi:hypothetical protein